METKTPRILLIVTSPMGVSFLTARLKGSACEIQFASSCYEAKALVSNHGFDLVLGEFGLRDESSSSLAASTHIRVCDSGSVNDVAVLPK